MNQTINGGQKYTVPKPFDLSQQKPEKTHKMMKEIKEKERSECTFKPVTNEGRNRQLIQEILEEVDDKENETYLMN